MKDLTKTEIAETINRELDVYQVSLNGVIELSNITYKVRVPFFNKLIEEVAIYVTELEAGAYEITDNDEIVGNQVCALLDSKEAMLFTLSRLVRIVEHDFNCNITRDNVDRNLAEAQNAFNKVCAKLMALGFESDSFNQ